MKFATLLGRLRYYVSAAACSEAAAPVTTHSFVFFFASCSAACPAVPMQHVLHKTGNSISGSFALWQARHAASTFSWQQLQQ